MFLLSKLSYNLLRFYLNVKTVLIACLTLVLLSTFVRYRSTSMSNQYWSVDFKVTGKVQGVFFRKFTKKRADELELAGWVRNEPGGTVVTGSAQGSPENVSLMKDWLTHTGSPYSRIDKAEFSNERSISERDFTEFSIRRK